MAVNEPPGPVDPPVDVHDAGPCEHDGADEREDAPLLRDMEEWGVARWPGLDGTLAIIADVFR